MGESQYLHIGIEKGGVAGLKSAQLGLWLQPGMPDQLFQKVPCSSLELDSAYNTRTLCIICLLLFSYGSPRNSVGGVDSFRTRL